jgi:hypothetical protein
VNYLGTNYSWADAVTAGYVSDFVFGWDRAGQYYILTSDFLPGDGYWLYAYVACDLWLENITIVPDEQVTSLEQNWNIISVPNMSDVNKTDLIVEYMFTNYSWSDAVTAGYVSDFVFGWDRSGQFYSLATVYEPGEAYWMYAYVNCALKQVIA